MKLRALSVATYFAFSLPVFAAKPDEKKVGELNVIERTYSFDLDACLNNFKSRSEGAFCEVRVDPSTEWKVLSTLEKVSPSPKKFEWQSYIDADQVFIIGSGEYAMSCGISWKMTEWGYRVNAIYRGQGLTDSTAIASYERDCFEHEVKGLAQEKGLLNKIKLVAVPLSK